MSLRINLIPRRHIVTGLGAVIATFGTMGTLRAQTKWPSKAVHLVVGFPPGGGADVMARAFQQRLADELGQPIIIDNKPGVGSSLAVAEVARAAPDGYTLFFGPTSIETANPYLFKLSVNPSRELQPVAGVARVQLHLVVRNGLPVNDLKELISYARANPGRLTYASSGSGTTPHLIAELFLQQARVQAVHIPFRGAAAALQSVLAGEVDFVMDPGIAFQHVRAGKARMFAVPSDRRPALFPDVPTMAEAGVPKVELDTWMGVWVPAGTPVDVTKRFKAALAATLKQPAVQERFTAINAEIRYVDTPEFTQLLMNEGRVLSALVKERKIVAD